MTNIKNKKAAYSVMIFAGALVLIAGALGIENVSSFTNIGISAVEIIAGMIIVGSGIYGLIKNS